MLSVGNIETMTRIGFFARGVMYLVIGFLAIFTSRAEDGAGALRYLDSGVGRALLAVMAVGFVAYAFWRLSEAAIDSEGNGSDAKGMAVRAGGVASGLIHLGLGFYAATLASGSAAGGGGSGGGATREATATALQFPGGAFAMTLAAAVLVLTGLYQLVKAVKGDFLQHLDPRAARQDWIVIAGRAGYAARGVVFAIMGVFLGRAALQASASQAADMGEALASLPGALQFVTAAGLALFGVFSFVEARYRRINDPQVLSRLKARVAAAR